MKRVSLLILIIGIIFLVACNKPAIAPATIPASTPAPELISTPTPAPTPTPSTTPTPIPSPTPTPQSDTTAPVIQAMPVSNITQINAVISWLTDEPASSKIIYGLTGSNEDFSIIDDRLSSTHSFELKWLQPNTSYRYKVYSKDTYGNEALSNENIFRTKAFPPDKGMISGTVLFDNGEPAYNIFVYIFKSKALTSFAFSATDKEGQYTFSDLPLGTYEIYSSKEQLGVNPNFPDEVNNIEKEDYNGPFKRPPEVVNLTQNQLAIAPTRTHFERIKLYYQREYLNTNQPEMSWDPVPTAAYYKVEIRDYLNKKTNEKYNRTIRVTNTNIVWPVPLSKMNYVVSVYAYNAKGIYLTDTSKTFWIGATNW